MGSLVGLKIGWPTDRSFAGLEQGYFQITNDFITDILRVASRGNAPWNNIVWDSCLGVIAAVRFPSFDCGLAADLCDVIAGRCASMEVDD